jgi:small-conductance mechanosensitive channel/CRP-like cAMP-binding protein
MGPVSLAAAVVAIALIGATALRGIAHRLRLVFDAACFAAATALLVHQRTLPLVGPSSDGDTMTWFRALEIAWWLLAARLIVAAIRRGRLSWQGGDRPGLVFDLLSASIYVATAVVILSRVLALPIGGVVATSGIVAVVLGLALQSTLADVFAGIAVGIEQPFAVGDRVVLADHVEGLVVQANWRAVHIQTDGADVAIVPNSVVAKSQIINRSHPTTRRAASITIPCRADASPERTIELLLQASMLCPDLLPSPAASASLIGLGRQVDRYEISFSVADSDHLGSTTALLLRLARRQLHWRELVAGSPGAPADLETGPGLLATRALSEVALFDGLDDQRRANLARVARRKEFEAGQALFEQGEAGDGLYIVCLGVVEVVRAIGKGTEMLGRLGAGEWIGEVSLSGRTPRAASARALTRTVVLTLAVDDFLPALAQDPELARAVERSTRSALETLRRAVEVPGSNAHQRHAQLLLRIRQVLGLSSGPDAT